MTKIAKICIDNTTRSYDKLFSYLVPPTLEKKAKAGCRALVQFGKGTKKRTGLIMEITEEEPLQKLKELSGLIDSTPLLTKEMLMLINLLKETTFCTYFEGFKTVVPAGIGIKLTTKCAVNRQTDLSGYSLTEAQQQAVDFLQKKKDWTDLVKLEEKFGLMLGSEELNCLIDSGILLTDEIAQEKSAPKTVSMVRLSPQYEAESVTGLTAKQLTVIQVLSDVGFADVKELCYLCSVGKTVIINLEKKGVVELFENTVYRNPFRDKQPVALPLTVLSDDQQEAFRQLSLYKENNGFCTALLYGVTGSGKTQVFAKLIEKTVSEGKNAILLVPEISLTPQTIQLFRSLLGEKVGVLHSSLSLGERSDEYKRIADGKVSLVVGTRSAVFAPLTNVGLIIIDEEQEHTYKSDKTPRYHARDIAKARCRYNGCMLLLASATPSVESYYAGISGQYKLVSLQERFTGSSLPDVTLVDMKDTLPGTLFSDCLLENMKLNLKNGEQTVLLLNRRGYHTMIKCSSCGEVATCPHCSIPLTYHQVNGQMMCHYCGYFTPLITTCENCLGEYIRHIGVGTQKAEEMLHELFPEARILRMDTDTTISKFAHERYFNEFLNGKYDIMIGTQMIAKGHNFPKVTLVGVLNADSMLYNEDFRSFERTFSLVTQVVGRSGRAELSGRAIIQTYTPESTVIQQASAQDYPAFYADEIATRRLCLYPPFCSIAMVGFLSENRALVKQAAEDFSLLFSQVATKDYKHLPLRVLGPCEPTVFKAAERFRYKLLIKYRPTKEFYRMINTLLEQFDKDKRYKDVHIFVDPYYDYSM